jgi:hypothetical protein
MGGLLLDGITSQHAAGYIAKASEAFGVNDQPITITQRYCHPRADAIERAFGKLSGGYKSGHSPELPQKCESGSEAALSLQVSFI